MSEKLVKALELLVHAIENNPCALLKSPYNSSALDTAKEALAAHKAKPTLSEEDVQKTIARSYYTCTEEYWVAWEQLKPTDIRVETCMAHAKAVLKALRDAGVLNVREE